MNTLLCHLYKEYLTQQCNETMSVFSHDCACCSINQHGQSLCKMTCAHFFFSYLIPCSKIKMEIDVLKTD